MKVASGLDYLPERDGWREEREREWGGEKEERKGLSEAESGHI